MSKEVQKMIMDECIDIANVLIDKNRKYGDSVLNPVRLFSKASTIEQINVRLDDKMSRIVRGDRNGDHEDPEFDIIGYLVLKRIHKKLHMEGGE